jgi:hypothetical protein
MTVEYLILVEYHISIISYIIIPILYHMTVTVCVSMSMSMSKNMSMSISMSMSMSMSMRISIRVSVSISGIRLHTIVSYDSRISYIV